MNRWPHCRALPPHAAAVLAALHLDKPAILPADWPRALDYADRSHLTLPLGAATRDHLPAAARDRLDRSAAANTVRIAGIEATYRDLATWLNAAGIEFLALKGLTHCALFRTKPADRVQYDIDLYLPRETIHSARRVLESRGYEPMPGMEHHATDHLPALIRKTGWQWRGDFFDPEIPLAIELHFQFWNQALDLLPAPGVEDFWTRRIAHTHLKILSPADALGYAALHLLKHVLHGSAKPFHAYEIARALETFAADGILWAAWREHHPPELRRLEAVAFRLAREWFGGRASPAVLEEIDRLPAATRAWFDDFALSPVTAEFRANKDAVWLHASLLATRRDKFTIAQQRLFPRALPTMNDAAFLPDSQITPRRRLLQRARWCAFAARRAVHHAVSLVRATASFARWWSRSRSTGESTGQ